MTWRYDIWKLRYGCNFYLENDRQTIDLPVNNRLPVDQPIYPPINAKVVAIFEMLDDKLTSVD